MFFFFVSDTENHRLIERATCSKYEENDPKVAKAAGYGN
jgi:hypothetical protein